MEYIAAVDPGRDKCGVAILDEKGTVLKRSIIVTEALAEILKGYRQEYNYRKLILGNGTTSKTAQKTITVSLPDLRVIVIDEYNTTQLAKREYWKANPPTGWRRLIPLGMLVPPDPVDDFVAVLLGRRYIKGTCDIVFGN